MDALERQLIREVVNAAIALVTAKQDRTLCLLENIKKEIELMGTAANTSAANLQAGETTIENKIGALGTAMAKSFADLQAEVAKDLTKAGVPTEVVDAVTAKFAPLGAVIDGLTAQATAADPGDQSDPVNPVPPATT